MTQKLMDKYCSDKVKTPFIIKHLYYISSTILLSAVLNVVGSYENELKNLALFIN